MSHSDLKRGAMLVLCGCLATISVASAEDRPADKILADIKAVESPKPPENRNDRVAIQDFIAQSQKVAEKKADLIGELFKTHPDSPELPKLIQERWQFAMIPGPRASEAITEMEGVLATSKDEKLVAEAAFVKGFMAFNKAGPDADADRLMPIAEGFIKRAPKDPRGAMFLAAVASKMTDDAKKDALTAKIEKDYPDSPIARARAGEKKLKEAIGKPFELEFNDAIKGGQVSMASLKGKVVIIDFWATWCGPCVAEMPNMKKLYAEYKDKGVEFIGVSLDRPRDQGGYDKLKAFVEKNKIEWPQYYEGKVSAGDFATHWGITVIPTVFAVGVDGNLATTEARGQLEDLIPKLLEKAKKAEPKP